MNNVSVVLVRPLYAINVGSVSRAMTNMGVGRLVLIDKQCEIDVNARKGAANGQDPLTNRIEYKSWNEFYQHEGQGLKIGLSARDGQLRQINELPLLLKKVKETPEYQDQWRHHTYFVFGPEDCGLSEEDLGFVHYAASLPTFGKNRSLNLAHAVLLTLYIMHTQWPLEIETGDSIRSENVNRKVELAPAAEGMGRIRPQIFPEQTIRAWLEALGFSLDDRRISAYTTLKRLLLHNVPSEKELGILESVLQQNIRKLKENGYPR